MDKSECMNLVRKHLDAIREKRYMWATGLKDFPDEIKQEAVTDSIGGILFECECADPQSKCGPENPMSAIDLMVAVFDNWEEILDLILDK